MRRSRSARAIPTTSILEPETSCHSRRGTSSNAVRGKGSAPALPRSSRPINSTSKLQDDRKGRLMDRLPPRHSEDLRAARGLVYAEAEDERRHRRRDPCGIVTKALR